MLDLWGLAPKSELGVHLGYSNLSLLWELNRIYVFHVLSEGNPYQNPLSFFSINAEYLKEKQRRQPDFWEDLNQAVWERLNENRLKPYLTIYLNIGKAMKLCGEDFNDLKLKSFGSDIFATVLSRSDKLDDLLEAKKMYEEIREINDDYYSKEEYEKVKIKIKKISIK